MGKTKVAEPEESGMGFKDKQKALDTLKILSGRDISYQFHVITSFVGRAKRTLQITKDEEKLGNIKNALKVFEDWLTDYKENGRGKENLSYLPIETITKFLPLAKNFDITDDEFYRAYKKEKGDYKNLRNVKTGNGETTWDVERNRRLKELVKKIKEKYIQWYETDAGELRGLPTREHVECIMLAYSPDPSKLKKLASGVAEKFGDAEDEMEVEDESRGAKRSREGSSSSRESDDSEPERKMPKVEDKQESGLSFKDKDGAVRSLESLNGRDVSYQYHAIAGLVKRAERVLTCTKDEQKIRNIKEAIEVFENWITDYNVNSRSKENFNYLPIDVVKAYEPLARKYAIEDNGFLSAYQEEAEGDYKKLRSIQLPDSKITWDVERNKNLKVIVDDMKESHTPWFQTDGELSGLPSVEHTRCIMWAFSHDAAKLKKLIPSLKIKLNDSHSDSE